MLRLILNCRRLRQDPTQHAEYSTGTTQKAPKGMEMCQQAFNQRPYKLSGEEGPPVSGWRGGSQENFPIKIKLTQAPFNPDTNRLDIYPSHPSEALENGIWVQFYSFFF